METTVIPYLYRIDQGIAIEGNGTVGDGRTEGMLEQAHPLLAHIHIGKKIAEGGREHPTRCEQVAQAATAVGFQA